MRSKITRILLILGIGILATACNTKKEDTPENDAQNKEFDITLTDILIANNGQRLLNSYNSVQYAMEFEDGKTAKQVSTLAIGNEEILAFEVEGESNTLYYENICYQQKTGDSPEYSIGWFMPGEYEAFMEENMAVFLLDNVEEEEIVSVEEKTEETIVTTSLTYGQEQYFYEYTLDPNNLNIKKCNALEMVNGEKKLVASSEVAYNINYILPEYVKELRNPSKTRVVKVIVDPGKEREAEYECVVPVYAGWFAVLTEYYDLYEDAAGTTLFKEETMDENGEYSDMTLYCIKEELTW